MGSSVEDSTDRTKKPKMNTFSAALLLTAGLVSSAPGGGHYKSYGRSRPSKNVFNTLATDPQFSTLVAAVTAAGLTEKAISDLGPLTIFAPTNDAFAKIPEDTLTSLLGDVPALTEILLRHVVPGKTVMIYSGSQSVDNAGGSQLTVKGYSVSSSAPSARVVGKSVATDGRVYAIDTVI